MRRTRGFFFYKLRDFDDFGRQASIHSLDDVLVGRQGRDQTVQNVVVGHVEQVDPVEVRRRGAVEAAEVGRLDADALQPLEARHSGELDETAAGGHPHVLDVRIGGQEAEVDVGQIAT